MKFQVITILLLALAHPVGLDDGALPFAHRRLFRRAASRRLGIEA
jgi:hypothetical protein